MSATFVMLGTKSGMIIIKSVIRDERDQRR